MKLVLFVSFRNSKLAGTIKNYLPKNYSLLEREYASALRLIKKIPAGIVLVDISSNNALPWVENALRVRPDLTYLAVGEHEQAVLSENYFFDFIPLPCSAGQVKKIFDKAWERAQLSYSAQDLQKKPFSNNPGEYFHERSRYRPLSYANQEERILCDFSRALGSNFNSERLLELFMDSVVGLVPAAKISILLKDNSGGRSQAKGNYVVFAQRGLDPHFCSGLSFNPSSGLLSWLIDEGRIFIAAETSDTADCLAAEALQELLMLQAEVSIPLIALGELLGALNLGPKVTGAPFFAAELEILYTLCGNVALALRDNDLHHQVINQKAYFENILQRMNSGVVAINSENRIITFNSRASSLLQLAREEAMDSDLRLLPSPLGDLLYDTLITGKAISKGEYTLQKGRIPLEISTFQLPDSAGGVLGSVMIFDDISERKQLEAERRQSDQLDVLNKFVSQLAHEIKNPMVAIQTFSELLREKYDDSSFREYFTYTVRQEVKRLNELVEQLIAFSSPLSYKYTVADIHEILDLGLLLLQEQGMGQETTVETSYCKGGLSVKADKTLLARAFSYLFQHSFKALEKGGTIRINTSFEENLFTDGGVRINFCDLQTKIAQEDLEKLFDPLSMRLNGYLSLGLPVSRKIIEDHGGQIKAQRRIDKHLELEVLLPKINGEGGEKGA